MTNAPRHDAPVLLWLHRELRLDDNAALAAALATGRAVVPVYVLDTTSPGRWAPGGASLWWLHHALTRLGAAFARRGTRLVLRRGPVAEVLATLARESGAVAVHAGAPVEPWAHRALETLAARGVRVVLARTATLFDPADIRTGSGGPYAVFTPFARACRARPEPSLLPAPEALPAGPEIPSDALDSWRLLPRRPDWAAGFAACFTPGEAGARAALERFVADRRAGYAAARDRPDRAGTSGLSPHLHFGEISPGRVWQAAAPSPRFGDELLWREFSAHLLVAHPDLPEAPLRPAFAAFPWRDDPAALAAWQHGRTGIPIVDAGMRELWTTGWMHNRVRMIAASFLVKHLLLPWQAGEAWFWDTLLDADLAANAASWQWVAGCGADAAPYFRIFNPVLQGEKFDPEGAYVRRWVPELAGVPARWVHQPWRAPAPPRAYPPPIVDLAAGRARALAAFAALRHGHASAPGSPAGKEGKAFSPEGQGNK